jgi:hypothetical protein
MKQGDLTTDRYSILTDRQWEIVLELLAADVAADRSNGIDFIAPSHPERGAEATLSVECSTEKMVWFAEDRSRDIQLSDLIIHDNLGCPDEIARAAHSLENTISVLRSYLGTVGSTRTEGAIMKQGEPISATSRYGIERVCATCRFFEPEEDVGQCRRHPPSLLPHMISRGATDQEMLDASQWPYVYRHEWCGDWRSGAAQGGVTEGQDPQGLGERSE